VAASSPMAAASAASRKGAGAAPLGGRAQQHFLWGHIEASDSKTQSNSEVSGRSESGGEAEGTQKHRDVTRKLQRRSVRPEDVTFLESNSTSVNTEESGGETAALTSEGAALQGGQSDSGEDSSDVEWGNIEFEAGNPTPQERAEQKRQQRKARTQGPPASSSHAKATVPQTPDGRSSSVGSVLHAKGSCTPCIAIYTRAGCLNGIMCSFCHMPHKRRKRKTKLRPCKGKRDRYRKLVTRLTHEVDADPEGIDLRAVDLPPSVASNENIKAKLLAQMESYRDEVITKRDAGGAAAGAGPRDGHVQFDGHALDPQRTKVIISL